MGLDGFSMSNLGLYNKLTSAQMANEVDMIVARGGENQVKDIDAAARKKGIERKDSDFTETGGQAFIGGDTSEEEYENLPEPEIELTDDEDDLEHSAQRYEMRVNADADIVELYDNFLGMTIQRLTIKDMLSMVKKFSDPSGVMINKKI